MKGKYILESMIESALQKDPKKEIAVKANTLLSAEVLSEECNLSHKAHGKIKFPMKLVKKKPKVKQQHMRTFC